MVDWTKKIKFKDGTPARLVGTLTTKNPDKCWYLVVRVESDGSDVVDIHKYHEDGTHIFGSNTVMPVVNETNVCSRDKLVSLGYKMYNFKAGSTTSVIDSHSLWLYDGVSIYDVVNNEEFFNTAWLFLSIGSIILFRYTEHDIIKVVSMVVTERDCNYIRVKIDDN